MRINRIKLIVELAKRDMSQSDLAELAGVSRATVNSIKGGKSCSDSVGQKIAEVLEIPIEQLVDSIVD